VSYYDDLGVPRSASAEQIDKAFRDIAKKYHPDAHPDDKEAAAKHFKQAKEAYEVLRNKSSRTLYDETLRRAEHPQSDRSASSNSGAEARAQKPQGSPRAEAPPQKPRTSPRAEAKPEPSQIPKPTSLKNPMLIALGVGAVLLLVAGVVTVARRPPPAKELAQIAQDQAEANRIKREEEEQKREDDKRKKEWADEDAKTKLEAKQKAALAKSELQEILRLGDSTLASLQKLSAEIDTWDKNVAPLLTDERGKSIAADDHRIHEFEEIWKISRPTRADVDALRDQIETILDPIKHQIAKDEPDGMPDESVAETLKAKTESIDLLTKEASEPRRRIERLVQVASRAGKKGQLTLQDAIEDLAAREETARLEQLKVIADKNREDLAKAEAARAMQEGENARLAVEAETQAAKKRADDAIAKEKLITKAKSPATRRLLGFFFTPGYLQPDGTQTAEKRPISLSRLDAKGCLEPTAKGQENLLIWALRSMNDTERPIWKDDYAKLTLISAAKREQVAAMQRALIELGPTLVELNMLDP
jgi:curved DNA-binding protein CbpA